jgi:hypothetical protein
VRDLGLGHRLRADRQHVRDRPEPAAGAGGEGRDRPRARHRRKSEREKNFIEAIGEYYESYPAKPHMQRMKALSDAFEAVAKRFPEDDETQIFSAVYLTATQPLTDKTYAAALKAAAILEVQFKKHPDHPGVAHYLIHSYDFPDIAEKGMSAARAYSEIAPSAPHALHMPSHIFTRVGAWKDSAAINERSANAAKQTKEPHDQLHSMDYAVYAYLQLGQDENARRVLREAREIKGFTPTVRAGFYALAAMPARIALERGDWKEATTLAAEDNNFPYTKTQTLYARALGHARSGNPDAAAADIQEIAKVVAALKDKDNYWMTETEVQRLTTQGWVEFAKGNQAAGLDMMRAAADMEDANEKSSLTPARMLPARELYGDMLMAAKRPADALAAYEQSQTREPNRYRGLFGAAQAAAQSGNREKARMYYTKLVEDGGERDPCLGAARGAAVPRSELAATFQNALDGVHDPDVAGAAAEISRELEADARFVGVGQPQHDVARSHQHSGVQ